MGAIAGIRVPGRLKPLFQDKMANLPRLDADNLANFVLDALNGLLYVRR
jgi:hypothetical protein